MAKFAKEFRGVKTGDIYPTVFAKDEECPPELEQAAAESKAPATSGKKKNEGK